MLQEGSGYGQLNNVAKELAPYLGSFQALGTPPLYFRLSTETYSDCGSPM